MSKRAKNLKVLNALLNGKVGEAKVIHEDSGPPVGLDKYFPHVENQKAEPKVYKQYLKSIECANEYRDKLRKTIKEIYIDENGFYPA